MSTLSERPGIVAIIAALAVVTAISVRVVSESRAELALAEAHHAAGDHRRATDHYRRTLRWSFPWSPFKSAAVLGLESLAKEREAEGDRPSALLAWRSLLGGLSSARFLYASRDPAAERAKDEIARLLSVGAPIIDANVSPEERAADHRHLLDQRIAPAPLWGTFLLLGFSAWLVSIYLLIQRGFDATGRPKWPSARGPLVGAIAGLASFILGLFFA